MRLYEITISNDNWFRLQDKSRFHVLEMYMGISSIFDRLQQGFNFQNNTEYWENQCESFNDTFDDAMQVLNSFPDQHDSFISNTKARFESYKTNILRMTDKLKRSGKIT